MNCPDAAERITALVDGELPPAEREELERHLAGCPACREARAAEEAVAARLRAAPRPALPDGFAAAVMAKVGAERPKGRVIPLWPLVAAATAVAAAVVAMIAVGPGAQRAGSVLTASAKEKGQPPAAAAADAVDREEGRRGEAVPAAEAPAAKAPVPVLTPALPPAGASAEAERKSFGEEAGDEKAGNEKAVKEEGPGADPKADEGTLGAMAAAREEDKQKRIDEAPAATRLALLYKVPVVVEAQRSFDGVLMANRDLASRSGPWTAPEEQGAAGKDSGLARRMAAQPEGRILVLRVRPENLDRLRAALDKAAGVKGASLDLLDRGDAGPPVAGGGTAGGPAPAPAKAKSKPAPAPAPVPPKEPVPGDDGALGPPPKPSAEQLRKLADAPPESKEGPTVETGTPSAEILVEVRLEVRPPEGGK